MAISAGFAVRRDRPDSRLVVFTLWLLVFGVGSQAMLIAPIIPQIATQLAVEEAALGTLITAYSVAVGAFALLVGPISDRVGRRPVLLAGTGLMTAALAAHWFAGDYVSLFSLRLLAGVAGGVLNGAAIAYVGDYFPPRAPRVGQRLGHQRVRRRADRGYPHRDHPRRGVRLSHAVSRVRRRHAVRVRSGRRVPPRPRRDPRHLETDRPVVPR
ncbi:MFS transporter [Halomarina oriensis]|uniref:MFS transporter n=1 Tax=Halomarina oriensis TaxID=671145 RepID=A0A6B0GP72_9EURY|nr:MFS transporter [Halomarina oriensis]